MPDMAGDLQSLQPDRIAVWLPSWVGDAVMATPTLRALRERFGGARISLIGRPAPLEVLRGAGLADEALADSPARAGSFLRNARELRGHHFDLAVLLPNSFRVALLAFLARIPRRLGYARDRRSWLLTDRRRALRDGRRFQVCPAREYYIDLIGELGVTVTDRQMRLAVTDEGEAAADRILTEAGWAPSQPLVVLNPGGGFGPSKRWPAERYAVVADDLSDRHGAQILINAAPAEHDVANEVAERMKRPPLVNMAQHPNSLALLKSLLGRCRLLITNDTGARHVAAALGAGVVTIFGSTDPDWTTINYERERIIGADVDCSPCQKKECPNPAGATFHQCMLSIEPPEVIAAAESVLAVAAIEIGGEGTRS